MALKRRTPMRRIVFFTILYVGVPFVVCSFVAAKMMPQEEITKDASTLVAEWDVGIAGTSEQSNDDKVGVVAGNEDEERQQIFNLTVTNDSDTASKYTIKLTGVPTGVMARLDEGGNYKNPNSSGVIILENTGKELGPHRNRNHTIEFVAKLAAEATVDHNVLVEIVFAQKDPR